MADGLTRSETLEKKVGIHVLDGFVTIWFIGSSPVWTRYGDDGVTYQTDANGTVVEISFPLVVDSDSPPPFYGLRFLGSSREEPTDRVEEYLPEPIELTEVYGG